MKKVDIYFRGVHFGGNADNRAQAGLAYANANNTPSNTNANIGSHLTCMKTHKEPRWKHEKI